MQEHNLKLNRKIFNDTASNQKLFKTCKEYARLDAVQFSNKSRLVWQFVASEQVKDILKAFDEVADAQRGAHKDRGTIFYFDSCHDINLLALMSALGIDYPDIIRFGSSLFFELHEDDVSQKLFVKVFLDEIELDINVVDHCDGREAPTGTHLHPLAGNTDGLDEADEDSSIYYYLKRYLLRRVFNENVASFCDKTIEEMIFVEHIISKSSTDSKHILMLSLVLSIIALSTILLIVALIARNRKSKVEKEDEICPTSACKNLTGIHHQFYDEEHA